MKWGLDARGRWSKDGGTSSSAAAKQTLRPNERLAPIVSLVNDVNAYAARVGDEAGWDQSTTAELFSSIMTLGLNWPALCEILSARSAAGGSSSSPPSSPSLDRPVVHRHLTDDEEVIYALIAPVERKSSSEAFTVCQLKSRYYTIIKKLTGDKFKYDLKADLARRQILRDRLDVDSHTLQNENKLRENLYILHQLSKQLEQSAAGNSAAAAVACLHPQITFPPISEAPKKPTLVDTDPNTGAPILSEDLQAVMNILRDAQPAHSTADYIIEHVNAKAVFCSQLVKHAEDAILTSFYPASSNKSATHYNHGKDYQDAIIRILKKARDSPEVATGVRTQDGDVITPSQYFTTDRFTPFVHTFTCFQAYSETIEACCVLTNLLKQLKALEHTHTQWLEKLMDVRKNARTTTRKKRI